MNDQLVAGEPVELLVEAFSHMRFHKTPDRDGMMSGSWELEPRLGTPFARALMRIEAELVLQDADRLGTPDDEMRTYEQRAADAFVALTLRVADACGV